MEWPANSPDLNPIENLWHFVKRNAEKRMPKNRADLERLMVEEWNSIPDSMLIFGVVYEAKNNGERISY